MGECELCGNEGSRIQVNHKEHEKLMVCGTAGRKFTRKDKKYVKGPVRAQQGEVPPVRVADRF